MAKLDWNAVAAAGAILVVAGGVIGWVVSVEVRMSQHKTAQILAEDLERATRRVANLEELLLPVLMKYKLDEELAKIKPPSAAPVPAPPPKVEEKARNWAESQLRRPFEQNIPIAPHEQRSR